MRRQVGSTFKPAVYLAAILKGEDADGVPYGPGHPAEDAPFRLTYDQGRQTWIPKNYEKESMGWISYRIALAHSINTIAAKLGIEVGLDSVIQTARALGIQSELPTVPSLALGVAELSPIELLRMYATLANHGLQNELTVIRRVVQPSGEDLQHVNNSVDAVSPGATDLLTDMLTTVFESGTAKVASAWGFTRPAAGKTGTTSNHRDSWFAGFTPQLTTVVWVGADQEHPDPAKKSRLQLTGASGALPIWVAAMNEALMGEPVLPLGPSPYLEELRIDTRSGKIASVGCPSSQVIPEKFLKDHEPHSQSCEALWPPSRPELTAP
jgi:membrane peptidoglycan carboxypeptidase